MKSIRKTHADDPVSIFNSNDFTFMYPFIDAIDQDYNGIRTGVQYAYNAFLHAVANDFSHEDYDQEGPHLHEICEFSLKRVFDQAGDFDNFDDRVAIEVVNGDFDPSQIDVQLIDFTRIIGSGVQRKGMNADFFKMMPFKNILDKSPHVKVAISQDMFPQGSSMKISLPSTI